MNKVPALAAGLVAGLLLLPSCQGLGAPRENQAAAAAAAPAENETAVLSSRGVEMAPGYDHLPRAQKGGAADRGQVCVWCREHGTTSSENCEMCRMNAARSRRGE